MCPWARSSFVHLSCICRAWASLHRTSVVHEGLHVRHVDILCYLTFLDPVYKFVVADLENAARQHGISKHRVVASTMHAWCLVCRWHRERVPQQSTQDTASCQRMLALPSCANKMASPLWVPLHQPSCQWVRPMQSLAVGQHCVVSALWKSRASIWYSSLQAFRDQHAHHITSCTPTTKIAAHSWCTGL